MRRMALIAGAIAALAVAALTLNTANAAPRGAQGSVISLVAATRTIAAADRGVPRYGQRAVNTGQGNVTVDLKTGGVGRGRNIESIKP